MTGQQRVSQAHYLCCACCLLILCLCPVKAHAATRVLVLFDAQNNTHRLVLEPLLQLNTAGPKAGAAVEIRALDYRNRNQAELDAADLLAPQHSCRPSGRTSLH